MLKVLMLRSKIDAKRTELSALEKAAEGFEAREAELASDIAEATDDEQRSVVEAAIESFENERSANTEAMERLNGEIAGMETEISELETRAKDASKKPPEAGGAEERKNTMEFENAEVRTSFFGMTISQRDAFMARDDVKEFVTRLRQFKAEGRSVTGAALGIPTVALDLLRSNINQYSKLMAYIRVRPLKGKARQPIAGAIPEAVWTEAIANLNELDISFSQVEVDGYKVGGYLAIPNSTLEDDADVDLLQETMTSCGQAIGKAVDKAIVYGTGAKMPVGIVTRLAATTEPSWWGGNQAAFTDLHTTNIKKLNIGSATGVSFFQPFVAALAIADPEYSQSGEAIWIMNRKTHMDILSRALSFDAAAALVAGIKTTMPVVGGTIIELSFMKDYEVLGGFFDEYLLVERSGANIRASDIPMMIQDNTVVVATQRYDGKPTLGEAFVLVSYDNSDATTSDTFAADNANTAMGVLGVSCSAGSTSGDTNVDVTGATVGATLKYLISGAPSQIARGYKVPSTWTTFETNDDITCAAGKYINVVEIDSAGKAVALGSAVAVPLA